MRLLLVFFSWVATVATLSCGGPAPKDGQKGEACTREHPAPFVTGDDCASGQVCEVNYDCAQEAGPCQGTCVKTCSQDGECDAGELCRDLPDSYDRSYRGAACYPAGFFPQ